MRHLYSVSMEVRHAHLQHQAQTRRLARSRGAHRGTEQDLLQGLRECQEGRCSCPSAEYEKLANMQVTATPDTVDIELHAKPGTGLEAEAVEQCLDFTLARLRKPT